MAKRPGGYVRNAPPRLPMVGIEGSLHPTGHTAANPQFLQVATSASARDLQQLEQVLGQLTQFGNALGRYGSARAAAISGRATEEGKRTAAEYVAAIGMGRSDDGSNSQYFPEDAYFVDDDTVVNPWLTPGMGVDSTGSKIDSETGFKIEDDPLWLYAAAQADAHTEGQPEEFQHAYRQAFVLPVYRALVKHRVDLTQKYDSAITGDLQSDLTNTDSESTTPNTYSINPTTNKGWTADEAFRNHRGVLGMHDRDGNPVQDHPMSMAEWQARIVLPAAELAVTREDWDTAERLLKWGENGDQVEAAKQQVKIDAGRSDDNLAVQRDLMGLLTVEYLEKGVLWRQGSAVLPPDIVETLTEGHDSAMAAMAAKIGEFYYTQGGSSNTARLAAFQTSIEGGILAIAHDHGSHAAVATINELLLATWSDPDTGEVKKLAPEGSTLNKSMRKWRDAQITKVEADKEKQYTSAMQENQVRAWGIIHSGLDNNLSAEEIREWLREQLGDIWGPVFFGDIASAIGHRDNEVVEGASTPSRTTWTSGTNAIGFQEQLLNAMDHDERQEIIEELKVAIDNGFVNQSRMVEAQQIMQSEPQYDQARNHPTFTSMMDAMTTAFVATLHEEGDAIVSYMDEGFPSKRPRVQQLGQAMMSQWRDFVKSEAMHQLWKDDRNTWEQMANQYVNNMRKAWWPVLGESVRDIIETTKGHDVWTGSVNAMEGLSPDGEPNGTYWVEDNENGVSKWVMQDGKPTQVKVVVSRGLWREWESMKPGEVTAPTVPLPAALQGNGASN